VSKRRQDHKKPGRCGRCGTLCLLTARRSVWHWGKVCLGCFNLCSFPVEDFARGLARLCGLGGSDEQETTVRQ
jgi:hypothetical protein